MSDRSNWEREQMQNRSREGNRQTSDRAWEDERNRGYEGRYSYGGDEWNRGHGRDEPYNENRSRYEQDRDWRYDREPERSRQYEGNREAGERGDQGYNRPSRGYPRGDYGPGAFTRQFRGGPEYFGTGQRGYGTTWGGSGYAGWGGERSYSGGLGSYSEHGPHSGRGPKGYQRSDERIREDICERLTHHSGVDASEIDIQVKNGEVTLTGTVERREEKRMAEDAVESVSGVKDVHNQLRAQPQGAMAGHGTQGSQANRETTGSKTK